MTTWFHNGRIRTNGAIPELDGIDIGAEDGDNIAIVFFDKHDHTAKEIRQRANLICAAPELLKALKSLVADLVDNDEEGLIEHAEPMIAARAAIARAEGKS